MAKERGIRAAIYARISRDTKEGQGVDRQEADCRALAKKLGWEVAAVYIDNDVSAYSGRIRPEYRAMLDAIRGGEIDAVLAWHTDRLHRRLVDLEEFVNVVEAHKTRVATCTAGENIDLSTASGRMVARTLGNMAQFEIDHARERMQRAKKQMAAHGKYRGGPRPYGYKKGGLEIEEREAQVIRESIKHILAGRSLAAVARELNARGEKTSSGRPWTYAGLKDVLIRPRNAGLLAHGDPSRPEGGGLRLKFEIVGPAEWPAIITEDEWRSIYALLSDQSRRRLHSNETKWLGSGIYICGICGGRLRPAPYGGTAKSGGRTRKYLYRCTESAHLTIACEKTDDYVREVVANLVRDPRVVSAMNPGDPDLTEARERRTALSARLTSFENDYALGRITGAQLQKATQTVTEELTEVDNRLAKALRRSTSSSILRAADPGAAFLAAPIDVQRAVLSTVLRVEVLRAREVGVKIGGAWTADRLRITPITA